MRTNLTAVADAINLVNKIIKELEAGRSVHFDPGLMYSTDQIEVNKETVIGGTIADSVLLWGQVNSER